MELTRIKGTVGDGGEETPVEVYVDYDGHYVMRWSDAFNEYSEVFHSLAAALARMALLAHCADTGYTKAFDSPPGPFERFVDELLVAGVS